MGPFLSFENLVALVTLTVLEITLGIDNLVFIALVTGRLRPKVQARARRWGLLLAMVTRILLLLGITWIMRLSSPLFGIMGHAFSGRDLILLLGGLFLIGKATFEIHDKLEGATEVESAAADNASFAKAVIQIMFLDVIFSLDSVVTAVGMARSLTVMIAAIMIAVGVMLFFAGAVNRFIERHPTMKMLALAFLLLIGVVLVTEGLGKPIARGYIYFAMAFSFVVELLNLRVRGTSAPVRLRRSVLPEDAAARRES